MGAVGWRPKRRRWLWMPIVFALLALGPFVHVAGINTYIPGPWALLRYVPIVGLARSPSRFGVLVSLGVALLFALALTAIGERWPQRRRLVLALVTVAAAPRALARAATAVRGYEPGRLRSRSPPIHGTDIRVLSLPMGVRDGTSSIGDFNPLTQYQQTIHGKRLVGGYLSRVTPRTEAVDAALPGSATP